MKHAFLPAVLGLSLLGLSCATQPTPIHGGYNLVATGAIYDNVEAGGSGGAPAQQDIDLSNIGFRAEFFTSPESSFFINLQLREYDLATSGSADGNELHVGGRYYFLADKPIQPFFQGGFFYGDNLDFRAGRSSDGYAGIAVGGGAAFYFSRSGLVEAGLRYDTTLLHPRISSPGGDQQFEISGVSGWVGLGISF